MKCVILAAGYATRLYPLTENFPKPLLPVGGKPILDHLLEDLRGDGVVEEFIVVSNHKYASSFRAWAEGQSDVTVLDDGTDSNETRLGAVRDLQFAIESLSLKDDLLVMAGDNLLTFSLQRFVDYALEKKAPCTMRYYEADEKRLLRSGIVTVDETDLILRMTEKSPAPETHWVTPAFYFFPKETLPKVKDAIADGCGVDAPGSLIAYLSRKEKVYAMEMPGRRYDIGTLETYEAVQKEFRGIEK